MTELELYKYINDNNIEWHRHDNGSVSDVLIFPMTFQVAQFSNLIKDMACDGGIECRLRDGYFAFWMNDICDYYNIDMDKVFFGEEY